ncbi:hypothetical protein D3C76_1654950 [compost metagenome]
MVCAVPIIFNAFVSVVHTAEQHLETDGRLVKSVDKSHCRILVLGTGAHGNCIIPEVLAVIVIAPVEFIGRIGMLLELR